MEIGKNIAKVKNSKKTEENIMKNKVKQFYDNEKVLCLNDDTLYEVSIFLYFSFTKVFTKFFSDENFRQKFVAQNMTKSYVQQVNIWSISYRLYHIVYII